MAALSSRFWTDFADAAVTLPVGIVIAVLLLLLREKRAAFVWTLAVGGTWGVMLVLKFIGYVILVADPTSPLAAIDLVTPSGHVASATVIYAALAGLLFGRVGGLATRVVIVGALVAVSIGITRVLLREHSVSEVIVGGAVGLIGAAAFAIGAREPLARSRGVPVLAVVAAIILIRYGAHLSMEDLIHDAAAHAVSDWRGPV